jgi:hypothetical protein
MWDYDQIIFLFDEFIPEPPQTYQAFIISSFIILNDFCNGRMMSEYFCSAGNDNDINERFWII